ncbi:TolC family protein [Caulobacter sp. Root655]|uniref:TolC family protein n=1 Tax=Caulobacter sp. Root655 TaxID=1736578 RepID=UPI00138F5DDF|nr:TolC family protein [Caulobacter sp. Root655]
MKRYLSGLALGPLALLGACAVQPVYQRPPLKIVDAWSNAPGVPSEPTALERDGWWTLLGDAAIDPLVAAGLADNPTLADAAARVDQARAALTTQDAARRPAAGVDASLSRSRDRGDDGMTSSSSGSVGASLSWELDLWGRLR